MVDLTLERESKGEYAYPNANKLKQAKEDGGVEGSWGDRDSDSSPKQLILISHYLGTIVTSAS